MSYKEDVLKMVDRYFMEIIVPYGNLNKAMRDYTKKWMPFQRKDYSDFIKDYKNFAAAAQTIRPEAIEFDAEDGLTAEIMDSIKASLESFQRLCSRNIDVLELYQRKSSKEKVKIEEMNEVNTALQLTLNSAMRDIDRVEFAYKELKATIDEDFAKAYAAEKERRAEIQEQIDEAVAEKKAKMQAKIDKKEKKQERKQEKKAAPRAATKNFSQAGDDDYEDIEDID